MPFRGYFALKAKGFKITLQTGNEVSVDFVGMILKKSNFPVVEYRHYIILLFFMWVIKFEMNDLV